MSTGCWADYMPPGPCPSDVITYYGAQPGWDTEREAQSQVNCSVCGHLIALDADGIPYEARGGAIDDEPDTVVAVCGGCSHSNRDRQLLADRRRSEAEHREASRRRVVQTPTGTLAERKAPQLRKSAQVAAGTA